MLIQEIQVTPMMHVSRLIVKYAQRVPLCSNTTSWLALYMTHCNPISLHKMNTRVLFTNPLIASNTIKMYYLLVIKWDNRLTRFELKVRISILKWQCPSIHFVIELPDSADSYNPLGRIALASRYSKHNLSKNYLFSCILNSFSWQNCYVRQRDSAISTSFEVEVIS